MSKTRKLPLTQGQFAIVDAEDYERLAKYNWCLCNGNGTIRVARGTYTNLNKSCGLAYEIMHFPKGQAIIHLNGNPLDHRKINLTIASRSLCNQRYACHNRENMTSKFRGVCWLKDKHKWLAQINREGKHFYLGVYDNEEDAARAYDTKALELHGKNAYRNFSNPVKYKHMSFQTAHRITVLHLHPPTYNNKSGFKGVCPDQGKCRAQIHHKGKQYYLGIFNTAIEAAKAYDKMARKLFGKNCYLNFPDNRKVS